jgi:hypothetical protein
MAAQQNGVESIFEPPTYCQEIYATNNGSYKLFLQVNRFNDCVRIGVTKRIWCEEANDYVFAKKGHCYFPHEACDGLAKHLAIAKKEAERVTLQVATGQLNCNRNYPAKNTTGTYGHAKTGAFAGNGHAGAGRVAVGAPKLQQRRDDDNAWPLNVAIAAVASASTSGSANEYKTDGNESEAQADAVEQGTSKKPRIATDDEETIVSKKAKPAVERTVFRRG